MTDPDRRQPHRELPVRSCHGCQSVHLYQRSHRRRASEAAFPPYEVGHGNGVGTG
ncbi:MAG TPA: hypothetical protein VGF67_00440 [Ktedonobacteraceae bacterium]